jgi:hypothetical protein
VREETGLDATVDHLLAVHDTHFTGTAPTGRREDFHGIHLVYGASVPGEAEPSAEQHGTTDAAAYVEVADIESGAVPVLDVVRYALGLTTDIG